jgi:hypothetical protein
LLAGLLGDVHGLVCFQVTLKLCSGGATIAAAVAYWLCPPPLFPPRGSPTARGSPTTMNDAPVTRHSSLSTFAKPPSPPSSSSPSSPLSVTPSPLAVAAWSAPFLVATVAAAWMVAASNTSARGRGGGGSGAAVAAAVVACKWSVAYAKTSLFVAYHPHRAAAAASDDGTPGASSVPTCRVTTRVDDSGSVLRWGGAGIQVGGLLGAFLFFTLTIFVHVL